MNMEEVKKWMKATNRTQADLAAAMGVATGTVNRWLMGKLKMSATKEALLRTLMRPAESAVAQVGIPMTLPAELVEVFTRLAEREGMTMEEWVGQKLDQYADELTLLLLARRGKVLADGRGGYVMGQDAGRTP